MTAMRKTVLIVDDNEALVEAMEILLGESYLVYATTDAYQAFKILREIEPSLIFLDCFMPGYSGLQFLREIRQMGLRSKVVIITAAEAHFVEAEINSLGVHGFLQKPFNVDQIENYASAA